MFEVQIPFFLFWKCMMYRIIVVGCLKEFELVARLVEKEVF